MCSYLIESSLNDGLTLGIQRRCSFIQKKDLGVADQSSSDCNPLLLSSTQLSPSVPDQSLKFLPNDKNLSIRERWTKILMSLQEKRTEI